MTKEQLEKEYEIRKLKKVNKQLMNTNTILNRQYKNLSEHFDRRINEEIDKRLKVEKQENKKEVKEVKPRISARGLYKDYEKLEKKYNKKVKENKYLLLRALTSEDSERRLKKIVDKKEDIVKDLENQNKEQIKQIKDGFMSSF